MARHVTVGDIVRQPLWCVAAADLAADTLNLLNAHDFDVVGVIGDPIKNYVLRQDLGDSDGLVGHHSKEILAAQCIERSVPLSDVIALLGELPYLFVLTANRITNVVTPADLQAPAVSVVVLSYLIALETGLKFMCTRLEGSRWEDELKGDARERADGLFRRKQRDNTEIGLEDCLYLEDWLQIVARLPRVQRALNFASTKAWNSAIAGFAALRNDLAHGGSLLDRQTPPQVSDLFTRLQGVATKTWMAVDELDPQWDVFASTVLIMGRMRLTGPHAVDELPAELPAHIVTAWNPSAVQRPPRVNRRANAELKKLLRRHELSPVEIVGSSPDGKGREESFLISGASRELAAEIGAKFGQLAIFELTQESLSVITCEDKAVVRTVRRRPDE